jgi:hypothetical protein
MKTYWGVDVRAALDWDEWWASHPGLFTPGRVSSINWVGDWVGPRADLDVVKRKFLTLLGLDLRPPGTPTCSRPGPPSHTTLYKDINRNKFDSVQIDNVINRQEPWWRNQYRDWLGCWMDDQGVGVRIPVGSNNFFCLSDLLWGPRSPLQRVPGALSSEIRPPGPQADHSPPLIA